VVRRRQTNLCHNAVDRHAATAPTAALIFVSTETGDEKTYSFAELQREVSAWRRSASRWASSAATAC
jgi:acyl-coenzyme A synthetase/AMP-(fatty) acid ligase